MAANLARAGFPLTVWNRTAGPSPGARGPRASTFATTAAEVAAASDIVVICVSDTPDVEAVLFGPDGVAAGARPGTLVIDCSTIAPSGSWDFAARLARARARDGRRPGLGRQRGRPERDPDDLRRRRRAATSSGRGRSSTAMGRTITHVGPIGAGQAVKAVNQVILAGAYLGVAEGIVLAIKAGLDVEQVVEALGGGAAQSWVLANRSGRMIDNDYPLGFKVALHRKDLGIALDLADQLGAACRSAPRCRAARDGPDRPAATATRTCPPSRGRSAALGPRGLAPALEATPQSRPTSSIGSPSLPS